MRYLIIVCVLLFSCNPLRHYNKVALDDFRNNAERALLSKACVQEFPVETDTPKVIRVEVDSTAYNQMVEAYNELLDTLIATYERERVEPAPGVKLLCTPGDSLRIIRNFLKGYKPVPIVRTEYIETKVRDKAWEEGKNAEIAACRAENDKAGADLQKARDKLKARTTAMWVSIGIGALLLLIGLGFLIGKIRTSVKI